MKKFIILLNTLLIFISCSPKMIETITTDGIIVERLNVKYLKDISSYKLLPTEKVQFDKTGNTNSFWLTNQSSDEFTTIYVKKENGEITKIKKESYFYKTETTSTTNFYSNGTLKDMFRTKVIKPPTNDYFEKITGGFFLVEALAIGEQGKTKYHFIFNNDAKYTLAEFIENVSKNIELKNKAISIGNAYIIGDVKCGDVGLYMAKKLKKDYPYWTLTYYDKKLKTHDYNLLIYDGITGELIENVLVKIQHR